MNKKIEVGQLIGERRIHVDRATLIRYAGASGDFNVIHWDEQAAKSVDLPDVIAHGMWTMGAAIQLVVDWCGDAGRVTSYGAKFTAPVPVPRDGGADIDISALVKSVDRDRLNIELTAASNGSKVLTRAVATVAIRNIDDCPEEENTA
ncbi:MaoC/PaaZ C-terminal domain-containing protein [Nocardia terpenica]|uniref:Acyl dehydratase n=1 Tax=Nocardia terpenica TaxID=455432 RepID=A0A6G9YZ27_9NOCA|nr:MaoC/PaaZ C-terminal domain-containing protein [Nocardia terpenica]QIS18474.1 acyl dehydratase [Nocardia terpenica]